MGLMTTIYLVPSTSNLKFAVFDFDKIKLHESADIIYVCNMHYIGIQHFELVKFILLAAFYSLHIEQLLNKYFLLAEKLMALCIPSSISQFNLEFLHEKL